MDAADGALGARDPLRRLVILLAASNGGEPIMGRARLQKMVFMLTRGKGWKGDACGYAAGGHGPHSDIVEEVVGRLVDEGVLLIDGECICVTQLGSRIAVGIAGEEDRRTLARIDEYKDVFNDLTADELSAYVYTTYPGMAVRSLTCDRTLSNMEEHTLSMLAKGKIALGRAAELLDRPPEYVWKMAARMRAEAPGDRA